MSESMNQRVVLLRHPDGRIGADDFAVREEPLRELAEGEVRVQTDCLSIDAFIRTTLEAEGYHARTPVGETVIALGVGKVIESRADDRPVGSWVFGPMMAQRYATGPAATFQPIQPTNELPPTAFLGVLGLTTGLTAWVGMRHLGQPTEGQTVVVSGAAGAVGSVAAQLAKNAGARVVGVAGGEEKCAYLTEELGLDAAVDYKAGQLEADLAAAVPGGIDVFFDNVGGELLDLVLDRLNSEARVIICGAISQYDDMANVRGPKLYLRLAERNAMMRGFTVDHYPQVFPEASADLGEQTISGRLKLPEHIIEGIDRFPEALLTLAGGGHRGKLLVRVS